MTTDINLIDRDAFTKREQASEDYYMRQKEIEKLEAMRKKIAGHQKHLEELDKTMYSNLLFNLTPLAAYLLMSASIEARRLPAAIARHRRSRGE